VTLSYSISRYSFEITRDTLGRGCDALLRRFDSCRQVFVIVIRIILRYFTLILL
jgi:hypothetical protein